jgi:hypothetical protein
VLAIFSRSRAPNQKRALSPSPIPPLLPFPFPSFVSVCSLLHLPPLSLPLSHSSYLLIPNPFDPALCLLPLLPFSHSSFPFSSHSLLSFPFLSSRPLSPSPLPTPLLLLSNFSCYAKDGHVIGFHDKGVYHAQRLNLITLTVC